MTRFPIHVAPGAIRCALIAVSLWGQVPPLRPAEVLDHQGGERAPRDGHQLLLHRRIPPDRVDRCAPVRVAGERPSADAGSVSSHLSGLHLHTAPNAQIPAVRSVAVPFQYAGALFIAITWLAPALGTTWSDSGCMQCDNAKPIVFRRV